MKVNLASTDRFESRHIGPNSAEVAEMLQAIGAASLDALIDETVPADIRLKKPLNTPAALSEHAYLRLLREIASKNQVFTNFIGLGYYGTVVPAVIQRNILENPGWYTQYTPYQAEIAQGRLEALLNYQTMVSDLTGMALANASLLDEGTAAAEAMIMLYHEKNKRPKGAPASRFLVARQVFPQTIDVLITRAEPLGIKVEVGDPSNWTFDETTFACMFQYPDANGNVEDYSAIVKAAHAANSYAIFASDLLALTLLRSPGSLGADVVVGNSQRFGVPMGFGGPHAGFFATTDSFKRQIPGRIIGVSVDSQGNSALRMALQTREQHIKREKATSNICTAQALLAIMAGMYGTYHGPEGLKNIATRVHALARVAAKVLGDLGYQQQNPLFFDTLHLSLGSVKVEDLRAAAESRRINLNYLENNQVSVSFDESHSPEDVQNLLGAFAQATGRTYAEQDLQALSDGMTLIYPEHLERESEYLSHPVFNRYHSESELMRYIKRLENRDLSLTTSMIPLGSCTMKLNAAAELLPLTWPQWAGMHPFAPIAQAAGFAQVITELEDYLAEVTGFAATSLQPNSGAQGEYAGLMVMRAYHMDHGDHHRTVVLIPSSAHGTNPASAVMAAMEVVVTPCDEHGNIQVEELRKKAIEYKDVLAGLMVTYPSTHGVFEESIIEICQIIHDNGGLVYMDGANMNAQVGLTNPASIGADVCHLNLHKTFAIPHGGGGPGMGPICVVERLAPYLPGHPFQKTGGDKAIHAVSAAPWGSALILLISYGYIRMLGPDGMTSSTKHAILNANYLKSCLEKEFPILYVGKSGRVAHEFIMDFRQWKQATHVEAGDVAKRLMDYGYHAPTVSFPVPGTLMIEPTESESKHELDKFIAAMLGIREEIRELENGTASLEDNVLLNSPHTVHMITAGEWTHPYSREKAAFPYAYVTQNKFWPSVARIDNSYGDRNLVCTCPPVADYAN
ncbi:MAG: aminomethyl-transferring glycine dehydrogenase [Bacteroidia bacterium]